MRRIFLIGSPGTGRTDITQNLSHPFNWTPINVGDLLRKEKMSNSHFGKRIQECDENMQYGKLLRTTDTR